MNNNTLIPIAIHGVPRSGTTWLGEIFNSSPHTIYKYQPLFSYALKDFLNPFSTYQDIQEFFKVLSTTHDDFLDQTEKRQQGILPNFEKKNLTHIVYKEVRYHNILDNLINKNKDIYLVTIIRNPFSVINSWLKAPREFKADLGWNILEEWRYAHKKNNNQPEEFNGYEKWKEATKIFFELKIKYPSQVYIIEYHKLLDNPLNEVDKMFNFCQLPIDEQTKKFINQSLSVNNDDAYSVYRKKKQDNDWVTSLPQEIIREIANDLKESDLEYWGFNYSS